MESTKRFLLIGDDERARFHPLVPIRPMLEGIFPSAVWTVDYEYPGLTREAMAEYDLIVNYVDLWGMRDTAAVSQALLSLMLAGGHMLVLHGGLIVHDDPAMLPVYGATFLQHPPRANLCYTPAKHPACAGIESFTLYEEPYMFAMDDSVPKQPVLSYEHEGKSYPAGWTTQIGEGRMLYLAPGHDAQVFENEMFRSLLRSAAAWCMGE